MALALSGPRPISRGTPDRHDGDSAYVFTGKVNLDIAEIYGVLALLDGRTIDGGTVLLKANNLSDLASASIARGNLGLGGAAVLNIGTTSGTVAAGNDTRITGATQNVSAAITGGTINGTAIGGTTPAAGAFTTVSASAPIAPGSGGTGYTSVSAALDALFSSTQGAILYRGASAWQGLPPGTSGQVLTTAGAGANPAWATPAAAGTIPPAGQARLVFTSSTTLTLQPYQGNMLWVNGAQRTIPSAGVTLSNTGLTAATLYYVYAYVSGSTLTLEASTTTHATDTTYGHEIKSGDGTRTLVGMIYTGAGTPGTFVDSATQRYVASWFNRTARPLTTGVQAPTTSSTTAVALASMTLSFVSWAAETTSFITDGTATVGTGGFNAYAQIYLDSSAVNAGAGQYLGAANQPGTLVTNHRNALSEGLHTAVLYGKANGSQVNYSIAMQGEVRQ